MVLGDLAESFTKEYTLKKKKIFRTRDLGHFMLRRKPRFCYLDLSPRKKALEFWRKQPSKG